MSQSQKTKTNKLLLTEFIGKIYKVYCFDATSDFVSDRDNSNVTYGNRYYKTVQKHLINISLYIRNVLVKQSNVLDDNIKTTYKELTPIKAV